MSILFQHWFLKDVWRRQGIVPTIQLLLLCRHLVAAEKKVSFLEENKMTTKNNCHFLSIFFVYFLPPRLISIGVLTDYVMQEMHGQFGITAHVILMYA